MLARQGDDSELSRTPAAAAAADQPQQQRSPRALTRVPQFSQTLAAGSPRSSPSCACAWLGASQEAEGSAAASGASPRRCSAAGGLARSPACRAASVLRCRYSSRAGTPTTGACFSVLRPQGGKKRVPLADAASGTAAQPEASSCGQTASQNRARAWGGCGAAAAAGWPGLWPPCACACDFERGRGQTLSSLSLRASLGPDSLRAVEKVAKEQGAEPDHSPQGRTSAGSAWQAPGANASSAIARSCQR